MVTTSASWRLLDHKDIDLANTIITYLDSSVVRRKLPISVAGYVSDDGYVVESVALHLSSLTDELDKISQIEVQAGPDEYLWKPDPVLTEKALNFEEP